MTALLDAGEPEHVGDLLYVELAGAALDRVRDLDRLLDGPAGLLVKMAEGQVSAAAVAVLLKARAQYGENLSTALAGLKLDQVRGQAGEGTA